MILISANAEWRVVREVFPAARIERSPYGEWFTAHNAVFVQGGWGKVDAAASAQYAIDRWNPRVVMAALPAALHGTRSSSLNAP